MCKGGKRIIAEPSRPGADKSGGYVISSLLYLVTSLTTTAALGQLSSTMRHTNYLYVTIK